LRNVWNVGLHAWLNLIPHPHPTPNAQKRIQQAFLLASSADHQTEPSQVMNKKTLVRQLGGVLVGLLITLVILFRFQSSIAS